MYNKTKPVIKKIISIFSLSIFSVGAIMPILASAQQNFNQAGPQSPSQQQRQWFNPFGGGQQGGGNKQGSGLGRPGPGSSGGSFGGSGGSQGGGFQGGFSQNRQFQPQRGPVIPGLGQYEIEQIGRFAKQAQKYGFTRVQEILNTLQDEISLDSEEDEEADEDEGFGPTPVELEDMKEIQQAVITALGGLNGELNVPGATAGKTRQKKNLVRLAIKLLERTKKNLDREIKRKEEDERFQEEEERDRDEQMNQQREQQKKFDREQRESFRGGPQQNFQSPQQHPQQPPQFQPRPLPQQQENQNQQGQPPRSDQKFGPVFGPPPISSKDEQLGPPPEEFRQPSFQLVPSAQSAPSSPQLSEPQSTPPSPPSPPSTSSPEPSQPPPPPPSMPSTPQGSRLNNFLGAWLQRLFK